MKRDWRAEAEVELADRVAAVWCVHGPISSFVGRPSWRIASKLAIVSPRKMSYQPPTLKVGTSTRVVLARDRDGVQQRSVHRVARALRRTAAASAGAQRREVAERQRRVARWVRARRSPAPAPTIAAPSAGGSSRCWCAKRSKPICRHQFASTPSSSAPPRKANPLSGSHHVIVGTIALSAGGCRIAADHCVKPKYDAPYMPT